MRSPTHLAGVKVRSLSLLLLLCVPACSSRNFPSTEPEAARPGDEWFLIHLRGKAAGYSSQRKVVGENGNIETISFTRMTIKRGKEKVTVEMRLELRESAAGNILSFRKEEKTARQGVTTVGKVIEPDRMMLDVTSGDSPARKQEVPFNPAARGFQYVSERISSTLKEEGDRLELVVFMPDLSRCVKQVSTLSTLENGLRQIENRLEVAPGNSLVSTDWVDDKGKAVRS
ncbi:MAG: hypothetical protein NZ935_11235, partial [Planctomycetes bacterium]|nr:hypothetical protein [Planctomycetota bacterium]